MRLPARIDFEVVAVNEVCSANSIKAKSLPFLVAPIKRFSAGNDQAY
jgi:hypothetical protein